MLLCNWSGVAEVYGATLGIQAIDFISNLLIIFIHLLY